MRIDPRYAGVPGVAFGGYVAGLVGRTLRGPVRVDLRVPAPFGRELQIVVETSTHAVMLDGDVTIAAATRHELVHDLPALPLWDEARLAAQTFAQDTELAYPECFGCGPRRRDGDGLRVFVGPIDDCPMVAGIWAPSVAYADARGRLRPEFVWATLDCPGGWARRRFLGVPEPGITAYLAADLKAPLRSGEPHLVVGWPIRRDGRKSLVGTLIANAEGEICVAAEALWVDRNP